MIKTFKKIILMPLDIIKWIFNAIKRLFKPRKRARLDISVLDEINVRGWEFTCEIEPNNYLITIKNKSTTKKTKKESD